MKLVLSHLDSLYSCDFCLNDIPKFLSASNLGFSVSQSVFPQGLEQGMVSTTPSGEQSGCQFSCPPLPLSLMFSAKPASSQERCRSGLTLPRAAAPQPPGTALLIWRPAAAWLLSLRRSEQCPSKAHVPSTASIAPCWRSRQLEPSCLALTPKQAPQGAPSFFSDHTGSNLEMTHLLLDTALQQKRENPSPCPGSSSTWCLASLHSTW